MNVGAIVCDPFVFNLCMNVMIGDVSVDLISDCWSRLNPCIWCCQCCNGCRLLIVVVSVGGALIFVGDGHNISHAGSGLQCQKIIG